MSLAEITSRLGDLGSLDYSGQILKFEPSEVLDYILISTLRSSIRDRNGDQKLIPSAESAFQVIQGLAIRNNDHNHEPLISTIERFEMLFNAWNPQTEVMEGMYRRGIPEFSFQAFREGLVNAFCHRDYTQRQPVRVLIDDEGLTISNPGGFLPGITLDDLLTAEPKSRNPLLTDIMKRVGLAERTGRGIDRIYEGSIVYGRPLPDYSESNSEQVKLFIPRAKPDIKFTQILSDEVARTGRPFSINALLVLSYLQSERRLTIKELSSLIHIGQVRTRTAVENLVESGLVEGHGTGLNRDYTLSKIVYDTKDKQEEYERQNVGANKSLKDQIIDCLSQNDLLSKQELVEYTGVSDSRVSRALKQLQHEEKVIMTGKARAARYQLSKDQLIFNMERSSDLYGDTVWTFCLLSGIFHILKIMNGNKSIKIKYQTL